MNYGNSSRKEALKVKLLLRQTNQKQLLSFLASNAVL